MWLFFSVFLTVTFVYVVVWPEQILSKKCLKFDGLKIMLSYVSIKAIAELESTQGLLNEQ